MSKKIIEVTIVDDRRREDCQAECGTDWSSPEVLALASQRIQERFGDKIKLAYLDLSKAREDTSQGWSHELSEDKSLPLPRLSLNGQLRISGLFDLRQLLDTIEVEIELGE